MSHYHTILKKLKDHDVPPPAGIFDAIQQGIAEEDESRVLRSEFPELTELKDASIKPPAFLLENILVNTIPRQNTEPKTIPFRKYTIGIAAALLAIIAVTSIIHYSSKSLPSKKDTAIIEKTIDTGSFVRNDFSKEDSAVVMDASDAINSKEKYSSFQRRNAYGSFPRRSGTAVIDGENFPIHDNDLLYSFTNFRYDELPGFIRDENNSGAVKVQVDKSSSINLSEDMVSMIRKTYARKRNGKPTFKAKREKKKLDRWKKADAKFFDNNVEKNPIDPIDLAEFIF